MPEEKKNKWLFKKTTYVRSKFQKWDARGKSHKVRGEMIEEMRKIIYILSRRIEKLKSSYTYARECWEAERKELLQRAKQDKHEALKELRREKNKEKSEERRGVNSLKGKLGTRDARIATLEEEKKRLTKELSNGRRREERLRKRLDTSLAQLKKGLQKRVIEKEVVPDEVKPIMAYLDKPLNKRIRNIGEAATLIAIFVREEDITINQLNFLLQLSDKGSAKIGELKEVGTEQSSSCEKMGLAKHTGARSSRVWYLTAKGEELTKKLIDKISYGKI